MRTIAPAKINWTLEVLGRREDGYHEIRSVMQTIDVCDTIHVWRAPDARPVQRPPDVPKRVPVITVRGSPVRVFWRGDADMREAGEGLDPWTRAAYRVASFLDPTDEKGAGVELTKHIPVASGLGGGSSDAAAALRSLNRLWGLNLGREGLTEMAADLGSDVPFFLYGGTALAEGRGHRITPLPDVPPAWLVVVMPPFSVAEKTKRMYEALRAEDFTDGSRSEALSRRLQERKIVREEDVYNVFENRAYEMFEGLETFREALLSAGAERPHLAGAGPALFALADCEAAAKDLAQRVEAPGAKVFVARTLTTVEATAIASE